MKRGLLFCALRSLTGGPGIKTRAVPQVRVLLLDANLGFHRSSYSLTEQSLQIASPVHHAQNQHILILAPYLFVWPCFLWSRIFGRRAGPQEPQGNIGFSRSPVALIYLTLADVGCLTSQSVII